MALQSTINILNEWLTKHNTHATLQWCIITYAQSRGSQSMNDICRGQHEEFRKFAKAQDNIGWRRFMEGMVATECRVVQQNYLRFFGLKGSAGTWMQGLMTKLMESTHGQWLYRNISVHDKWTGSTVTLRKEQLLAEIEEQIEMEDDLLEEDQYLMEINLGNLNRSSGVSHEYWLLAVKAARAAINFLTQRRLVLGRRKFATCWESRQTG